MADNLKVADEEFRTAAYKVQQYGAYLSEACAYYVKIMQYILDEAIQDEAISNGIRGIMEHVKPLGEAMVSLATGLSGDLKTYLEEIDEKDSFLF